MIKENTQSLCTMELSLTLANYTALLLLPHFVLWGLLSLVPRPPSFSFFGLHFASVYYTEHKLKNKNGGGLGTRLGSPSVGFA